MTDVMATSAMKIVICVFAVGCTLAKGYAIDGDYCFVHGGSNSKTVKLQHQQSAIVNYNGSRIDMCGYYFHGGAGYIGDHYQLCVDVVIYNVSCSVVTIQYYAFLMFGFKPEKTFTCENQPERFCTKERTLFVGIEAKSETSGVAALKITATDLDASGVPGLKPTLLFLVGLYVTSKILI